jgi:hypothetical protein
VLTLLFPVNDLVDQLTIVGRAGIIRRRNGYQVIVYPASTG